ncbi:MAG: signal peptidase I [Verrucomicrobiota bacterium]|nr:signal peptidase I [Verrucomicrobiota bacterium]
MDTHRPGPRSSVRLRAAVFGRNWKFTLARVAIWVVLVIGFFRFVVLPVRVSGISMLPTCPNHSINFINRLAYIRHGPQRFDIVAVRLDPRPASPGFFQAPPHVLYFKRIIGLPGETVAFSNGRLIINGKETYEPYENFAKYPCFWDDSDVTDGSNQYYVVGDNRTMPAEDHQHGRCLRSQIIGKAML